MRAGEHDDVHVVAARLAGQPRHHLGIGGGWHVSPRNLASASPARSAGAVAHYGTVGGEVDGELATYDCRTVAGVPSTPMTLVRVSSAAGLIAGTVPTTGTSSAARTCDSAIVEAVLHAMTISRGR